LLEEAREETRGEWFARKVMNFMVIDDEPVETPPKARLVLRGEIWVRAFMQFVVNLVFGSYVILSFPVVLMHTDKGLDLVKDSLAFVFIMELNSVCSDDYWKKSSGDAQVEQSSAQAEQSSAQVEQALMPNRDVA
jgi:hypothetical protein